MRVAERYPFLPNGGADVGVFWSNSSGWRSNGSYCGWFGITCRSNATVCVCVLAFTHTHTPV